RGAPRLRARPRRPEPAAVPGRRQRAALCGHLNWMAAFLHRHHEGEDDTLYPMVTAANPAAAALVGAMAADHGAVQSALEAVESAAARTSSPPSTRWRRSCSRTCAGRRTR